MSIEGLGKRLQEARKARGISLEEAARLTKIRQSRLAELEADDFSNFPSLAYAKGFLQIYGKFLNVDVSPYLDTFESSEQITVDGYSYLQDAPVPKPVRTTAAPRETQRGSLLPLIIGLGVLFVGFWLIRLILNVQRITPPQTAAISPTATAAPAATVATIVATPAAQPPRIAAAAAQPTAAPVIASATPVPTAIAVAPASTPRATEPEVRRAQPVRPEELEAAIAASSTNAGPSATNRVDIRPLKRTYVQVTVDGDPRRPVFERWISPADGVVQFRGHHFSVKVLDRDAIQVRKNGKVIEEDDADVTIE